MKRQKKVKREEEIKNETKREEEKMTWQEWLKEHEEVKELLTEEELKLFDTFCEQNWIGDWYIERQDGTTGGCENVDVVVSFNGREVERIFYMPRNDEAWIYRVVFKPVKDGGLRVRVDRHTYKGFEVELCVEIPKEVSGQHNIRNNVNPGAKRENGMYYAMSVIEAYKGARDECKEITFKEF